MHIDKVTIEIEVRVNKAFFFILFTSHILYASCVTKVPQKTKNNINISPTKFNLNAENIKYIGIPIAAPIVEYIKAFVEKINNILPSPFTFLGKLYVPKIISSSVYYLFIFYSIITNILYQKNANLYPFFKKILTNHMKYTELPSKTSYDISNIR